MRRLFLISALLCLIIAYQLSLPSKVLEWSLQSYCRSALNSDLRYQHFTLNRHCLTIDQPSLSFFSAKQMVVHYSPKWLGLHCRIEVIEPLLEYPFKELPLLLLLRKLPRLDLELVVESGRLLNCQFSLEAEKKAQAAKGCLRLSFGEEEKMVVNAAANPQGQQASIELQKVKIETLAPWLHLKNLEGELNGYLNIDFEQVLAKGDITLSNFALTGPQLQGSCPDAHLLIDGGTCSLTGNGHFHTPHFEVNGLLELEGSYPENTLKWDFNSVKGEGQIDSNLQLKGRVDQFDFLLDLKKLKGSFTGQNLPIEKYLANSQGVADLDGRFDLQGVDLAYRLHNLKVESPGISFETVGGEGTHRFDFAERKQSGRLPLTNGTLKYRDLVCTDISTIAQLKEDQLHLADLKTSIHGIPFTGAAEIDFQEKWVEIRPRSMQASVAELQRLFAFQDFPLDGVVNIHKVRFDKGQMEAAMQLTQGRVICPHGEISRLQADILLLEERVELTNLKGSCLLDTVELPLTGGSVHFAKEKAHFDLSFEDLRLCGKTSALSSEQVLVELDHQQSYFGKIHPSAFSLEVKNGTSIKSFQMETKFPLSALIPYTKSLRVAKAEGEMQLSLNFEENDDLRFRLDGQNIALDDRRFAHFLCVGRKKHATWSIDQAEIDKLSFSADLTHTPESWKINFLGLRYGEALLMGLEGEYASGAITGRVNLLEADLSKLEELSFLSGTIHAQGEFNLQFSKMAPKWKIDALLTASLRSIGLQGMVFSDQENIPCQIRSDRGITLQNLDCQISQDNQPRLAFKTEKLDYDFNHEELEIEGLDFQVPHHQMGWLAAKLPPFIPDLSQVGDFKGRLDLQKSPGYYHARLKLDKGKYRLYQLDHHLDQFTLDIDPMGLDITSKYRIHNQEFPLECHSQSLKEGQLLLEGLTIDWEIDESKNIVVKKAAGTLAGISMDLVRNQEWLTGEVSVAPPAIFGWPISKGFSLQGKWKREAFQGELSGSDFERLKGQVTYSPGKIIVRDFCLKDAKCHLETDLIALDQTPVGEWLLSIPQMLIQNLKTKPFTIKAMDVKNFKGNLFTPSTYTGSGSFSFINTSKRNLPALFATPAGLDASALIPVKGTIDYEIKEQKICFTKLKNVYSEGKIWKFSLPNTGSYLDFSGNLNVQLCMKQISSLLKMTEHYTFNIEGPYEKPSYSLQRQKSSPL